jgi:hypothetical protein
MARKPPWTPTANTRIGFIALACLPACGCWRACARGCAAPPPGNPRSAVASLPVRSDLDRRLLRNAVGQVGVKLVAAPDAPPWGQVLVRNPSGWLSACRWCAISTLICPSRQPGVGLTLTKGADGLAAAAPMACQLWRWRAEMAAGWRYARWQDEIVGSGNGAEPGWRHRPPGQRDSGKSDGRNSGRRPHPGKDPS